MIRLNMSVLLLFVSFFFLNTIKSAENKSIGDNVDTDLKFIRTCNHTSPISMSTMNDVLINKKLRHHSSNFKCFLHCLFKQYGWMDLEGGFLLHDIKGTLQESEVDLASVEFILYKCTALESSDRCERAFQFTQCFWDKMADEQPTDDQLFYNLEEK